MEQQELLQLAHRFRTEDDHSAFEILFSKMGKRVWTLIYHKVPATEAENVFQEVSLAVAQSLARDRVTNIPALVYTVTKRKIADYHRAHQNQTESLQALLEENFDPADPQNPEPPAAARVDSGRFLFRSGLSEEQRETLILRFWTGHTVKEVAELMGISANTVKKRITLAKIKIRMNLSKGGAP